MKWMKNMVFQKSGHVIRNKGPNRTTAMFAILRLVWCLFSEWETVTTFVNIVELLAVLHAALIKNFCPEVVMKSSVFATSAILS